MSGEVRKQNRVSFSYSQIRLQNTIIKIVYILKNIYKNQHYNYSSIVVFFLSPTFFTDLPTFKMYEMIKLCVCEKEHRIKTCFFLARKRNSEKYAYVRIYFHQCVPVTCMTFLSMTLLLFFCVEIVDLYTHFS